MEQQECRGVVIIGLPRCGRPKERIQRDHALNEKTESNTTKKRNQYQSSQPIKPRDTLFLILYKPIIVNFI